MESVERQRRAVADSRLDQLEGWGATGASQVVRSGAALLVRRGSVLVRARPDDAAAVAVAEREVTVARALAEAGVPVIPLVDPAAQPWREGGGVVTAWRWIDAVGSAGPADLGVLARALRERSGAVAGAVPVFDPLAAAAGVVAGLADDDVEAGFVRDRAATLAESWAEAAPADPLGRAVVHGDLHAGNVVVAADGPLLTDLELSGSGPSSYDIAPAVVGVRRYGADPAGIDAFVDGAGPRARDALRWPGFATFVAVYELWVTAWAVGVRHQDPTWAAEASRRVETLRNGSPHRWTLR